MMDSFSNAFITIIRAGVVFRVIYCAIRMQSAEDDSYKRRLIHAIWFYIFAESAFQIKELILYYFQ